MAKAKSRPVASRTLSAEDYNAIIFSSEIMDVKLIKSDFHLEPSFFDEGTLPQRRMMCSCEFTKSIYNEENKVLIGFFEMDAGTKLGNKWLLRLKATYFVAYDMADGAPSNAFDAFLNRIGTVACYPYFRSVFANTCAAAGADLPTLPILRAPPLGKKRSNRSIDTSGEPREESAVEALDENR